jgi:RHS repeat-associated protein
VPLQNTDTHGTANLIPGNTGTPSLQTGTASVADRWNLTDKLGSTIAQTTDGTSPSAGAVIGELSDYSDYGIQGYGTTGFDADPNYTAQPTNATHQFHARTQDPQTGTWTTQDTWRGLLSEPQTLGRYAYVTNNPATQTDYMGYYAMIDDGGLNNDFGTHAIDLLRPPPPAPPFYFNDPHLPHRYIQGHPGPPDTKPLLTSTKPSNDPAPTPTPPPRRPRDKSARHTLPRSVSE